MREADYGNTKFFWRYRYTDHADTIRRGNAPLTMGVTLVLFHDMAMSTGSLIQLLV